MSQPPSKNYMSAADSHNDTDNFPYIPVFVLILFLATVYLAFLRSYKQDNIYYFTSEEEVDNFDPLSFLHGSN